MLTLDKYLDNHYIHRSNWLRAAVLGANDGIIPYQVWPSGLQQQVLPRNLLYWLPLLALWLVHYPWRPENTYL